jgi:hypothetical protein
VRHSINNGTWQPVDEVSRRRSGRSQPVCCVAPRSNASSIRPRRALQPGRLRPFRLGPTLSTGCWPFIVATLVTLAGGCTGATGVATLADGGLDLDPGRPARVPTEHRAQATSCEPAMAPDGGGALCSSDAECASGGGGVFTHCLRGRCSMDACLSDSDCKTGGVCGCASNYYGGNSVYHPNICVPSNCHVDGDCGAGGYCSPNRGRCGVFEGFYCHRSGDACYSPAECAAPAAGGLPGCRYTPTAGAFVCASDPVCGG